MRLLNSKIALLPSFAILLLLMLSACEQRKYTYAYLMQHPTVLKRAVAACKPESTAQTEQCEIVLYAAAQFTSLLNEQQSDPQAFGERLLRAQMLYAKANHGENLADEKQEINDMLAVIGVNSPE